MSCWICGTPWMAQTSYPYIDICVNGCMAIERVRWPDLSITTYSIFGLTWAYNPLEEPVESYHERHKRMDLWIQFLHDHRSDPMVASFLVDREPLVFADWCDENGFPDVARLLRGN